MTLCVISGETVSVSSQASEHDVVKAIPLDLLKGTRAVPHLCLHFIRKMSGIKVITRHVRYVGTWKQVISTLLITLNPWTLVVSPSSCPSRIVPAVGEVMVVPVFLSDHGAFPLNWHWMGQEQLLFIFCLHTSAQRRQAFYCVVILWL